MEHAEIVRAVDTLRQQGQAVTATKIREVLGHGSYRDIYAAMKALKQGTSETDAEGTGDESSGEAVALAQVALGQARQRLSSAQEAHEPAERAVVEARQEVRARGAEFILTKELLRLGALPHDEAGLLAEVERDMWAANKRLREAKARLAELPREIAAAQAAVRVTEQHLWLARERPDLLEALASVQAEPAPDPTRPDAYYAYAVWKQRLTEARQACEEAVQAAGL
jgi:Plasmid replication region DNA-binding N-term